MSPTDFESSDESISHAQAQFATTHWSVVLKAGTEGSPNAREAMERLCRTYWYPLYAFVRRSGHDAETSKDLTQGFFERFLEKDYLREVNPERGRFRSFLLASLKHFLANERDRRQTLRRGGHYRFVVLDENWIESCERQDAGAGLTPEALYELRWALAVLDSVRARLAADYSTAGKGQLFDALQVYLTGEPGHAPYAEVAARLDLSVDAVKKSVERLRRRYGELLREEIAQAVSHPREIEDEIQHLRRVLAG